MVKEELITALFRKLPSTRFVRIADICPLEEDHIYFFYGEKKYKGSTSGHIEECNGALLTSNDYTELLGALIKNI